VKEIFRLTAKQFLADKVVGIKIDRIYLINGQI